MRTALVASSVGADAVERFRGLLGRRLGLSFDETKLAHLEDVLQQRLLARNQDAVGYLSHLDTAPAGEEDGYLAQALTVPETYFFRNVEQFHALAQLVLPERARAAGPPPRCLRLLSAGCASGEEAYSLAIVGRALGARLDCSLEISAVDVNPVALDRARRAEFSDWSLRETPPHLTGTWFRRDGRRVRLDPALLGAVQFEQRNLAVDDPELWRPERYDVVFCRNVLMYLLPEAAQALVARITHALVPGGFLFLGHAETLRGLSQDFDLLHTHGTFYYQRRPGQQARDLPPAAAFPEDAAPVAPSVDDDTSWLEIIKRASERIRSLAQGSPSVSPGAQAGQSKPDLGAALELLAQERFSQALELVEGLASRVVQDPDVLMLQAVLLTHRGELDRATSSCKRLLAVDGLSAGAHYVLALCDEARGQRASAADHDQVAIYLDPAFAMPRLHLGSLRRRAGDLAGARRELEQALVLLRREDPSRLLLFGGGFGRETLVSLCAAQIVGCGGSAMTGDGT